MPNGRATARKNGIVRRLTEFHEKGELTRDSIRRLSESWGYKSAAQVSKIARDLGLPVERSAPKSPEYLNHRCRVCGEPTHTAKYICANCLVKDAVCEHCGRAFKAHFLRQRNGYTRFCSQNCTSAEINSKPKKKHANVKKATTVAEIVARYQSGFYEKKAEAPASPSFQQTCLICGEFSGRRSFCDEHYIEAGPCVVCGIEMERRREPRSNRALVCSRAHGLIYARTQRWQRKGVVR